MNTKIFIVIGLLIFSFTACKGEKQRHKEQLVAESITEIKTEIESNQEVMDTTNAEEERLTEQVKSTILGTSPGDSIIGIWEVKNDYYMAIYEILKYKDEYIGKMHYYNDGKSEYEAQGNEEDYFLDGITYANGKYSNGNIYMPGDKKYSAEFTLEGDTLQVKMTMDGYPYTEIWKRKEYKDISKTP